MVSDRTDDKLTDFGWLDFSAADMKRTRDALTAISSDSVDELGISIIRDGFAELLFPGLSVIQTSLSKEHLFINDLLKLQAVYRMVIGQPHQDELLSLLRELSDADREKIGECMISLSPPSTVRT